MIFLIKKALWGVAGAWALRKGKDWYERRHSPAASGYSR